MDSAAQLPKQQISRGISSNTEVDVEAILKGIGLDIHLLVTESTTDLDVVFAANHVERVGNLENVGPALEGSEPTISESPVIIHQGGAHAAAHTVFVRLRCHASRGVRAFAVQV